MKKGLSCLADVTQSGFLCGPSIHNNIHNNICLVLIWSIIVVLSMEGFVVLLDFYKSFDSVEHPFILNTLNDFCFGHKFINLIGMLYNDINSSVAIEHGTCRRFRLNRGIRQGCNSSPLLFFLVQNY